VVALAVTGGARFVDTAMASRNERALAAAVGASGVDGAIKQVHATHKQGNLLTETSFHLAS
jgi:hypothetical protein